MAEPRRAIDGGTLAGEPADRRAGGIWRANPKTLCTGGWIFHGTAGRRGLEGTGVEVASAHPCWLLALVPPPPSPLTSTRSATQAR